MEPEEQDILTNIIQNQPELLNVERLLDLVLSKVNFNHFLQYLMIHKNVYDEVRRKQEFWQHYAKEYHLKNNDPRHRKDFNWFDFVVEHHPDQYETYSTDISKSQSLKDVEDSLAGTQRTEKRFITEKHYITSNNDLVEINDDNKERVLLSRFDKYLPCKIESQDRNGEIEILHLMTGVFLKDGKVYYFIETKISVTKESFYKLEEDFELSTVVDITVENNFDNDRIFFLLKDNIILQYSRGANGHLLIKNGDFFLTIKNIIKIGRNDRNNVTMKYYIFFLITEYDKIYVNFIFPFERIDLDFPLLNIDDKLWYVTKIEPLHGDKSLFKLWDNRGKLFICKIDFPSEISSLIGRNERSRISHMRERLKELLIKSLNEKSIIPITVNQDGKEIYFKQVMMIHLRGNFQTFVGPVKMFISVDENGIIYLGESLTEMVPSVFQMTHAMMKIIDVYIIPFHSIAAVKNIFWTAKKAIPLPREDYLSLKSAGKIETELMKEKDIFFTLQNSKTIYQSYSL
jgi:hypothetical protein